MTDKVTMAEWKLQGLCQLCGEKEHLCKINDLGNDKCVCMKNRAASLIEMENLLRSIEDQLSVLHV